MSEQIDINTPPEKYEAELARMTRRAILAEATIEARGRELSALKKHGLKDGDANE